MNDFTGFADLEDWDAEVARPARKSSTNVHVENIGNVEIPGFTEDCPKCRGEGVCGRLLEDENSIAAGIGPICASKL